MPYINSIPVSEYAKAYKAAIGATLKTIRIMKNLSR